MVQHSEALGRESDDPALASVVAEGRIDELPTRIQALFRYAIKLTLQPWDMHATDVEALRAAGLDDRAIVDANQVASYFNYVNRVASGLGVELEPQWAEELRQPRRYPIRQAAPE